MNNEEKNNLCPKCGSEMLSTGQCLKCGNKTLINDNVNTNSNDNANNVETIEEEPESFISSTWNIIKHDIKHGLFYSFAYIFFIFGMLFLMFGQLSYDKSGYTIISIIIIIGFIILSLILIKKFKNSVKNLISSVKKNKK